MKVCKTCVESGRLIPAWIAHPVLCESHAAAEMKAIWEAA